jgi:hypothetical protein
MRVRWRLPAEYRMVAVMILVYGDDSADKKRDRVAAVAAVFGSEEMWGWIEPQWIARNDGVPFHARDCESDRGDYRDIPHEKNKGLYKDLATMLAFSELIGLGIAIDLVAQRIVFPQAPDLAYYKAFTEIMAFIKRIATRYKQPAKFVFDISTENEYNAGLLYDNFRSDDPEMMQYFDAEISFVPAKYSPRVQIADLLAYEAMKALDNTLGPKPRRRRSWEALRATDRFEVFSFSEEWFKDLKRHLPELEQKVGFNQQDYTKWLNEKNRHHNTSNLFHFVNWIAKQEL